MRRIRPRDPRRGPEIRIGDTVRVRSLGCSGAHIKDGGRAEVVAINGKLITLSNGKTVSIFRLTRKGV